MRGAEAQDLQRTGHKRRNGSPTPEGDGAEDARPPPRKRHRLGTSSADVEGPAARLEGAAGAEADDVEVPAAQLEVRQVPRQMTGVACMTLWLERWSSSATAMRQLRKEVLSGVQLLGRPQAQGALAQGLRSIWRSCHMTMRLAEACRWMLGGQKSRKAREWLWVASLQRMQMLA